MAYGMAGRSPKTGGPLQAPQQPLQRLSPGVYRGPEGNLVNAQGGTLPGGNLPQTRQPQPQSMAQQPMMAMPRPTPGNMPMMPQLPQMPQMPQYGGMPQFMQQGGMMQPPQQNGMMQPNQQVMRPAVMPTFPGMNGMFPYNK